MQAEPRKADSPKRKRHWFQFRLRSLMIAVTMFCVVVGGYVGWQAQIVRDRWAMRERITKVDKGQPWGIVDSSKGESTVTVPWIRRLLGDEAIYRIVLPLKTDREERRGIRQLFPEAALTLPGNGGRHEIIFHFPNDD